MVISGSASSSTLREKALLDFNLVYISKKEAAKITFDETLLLVNQKGNVVDEVTISVVLSNEEEGEYEVSQSSKNEKNMLKTWSLVTSKLETKSELRKISLNGKEKFISITNLPDKYRIFEVETDLQQRSGSRLSTELRKSRSKPFLPEGANVLFLRKLAMFRQYGAFSAETVDNNGQVCEAQYMVETLPQGDAKVTRTVGSETMTTVLNVFGRIMFHKWSDSHWKLKSPVITLNVEEDIGTESLGQSGLVESESFPEVDLPAYWQKKEEVINDLKQYMVDNCDVQDMIADMMKNILFVKPDDPIDFADKFLSEFAGITRESDSEPEDELIPPTNTTDTSSNVDVVSM